MPSITALRARVESSLAGRIPAPFAYRDRRVVDTVSCGIPEIDRLTGGLPRGGLTEICGPPCSGRTSLLLSALAARTAQAEACALVDGRDGFDPQTARAAGVRLEQLLWVRCREIEQALRATDLLLRGGGFGLIAVDLADIEPKTVRDVPLNAWFRFRRAVEDTPAILLLVEQESNAKTCASLVLQLAAEGTRWLPQCRTEGRRHIKHGPVEMSANLPPPAAEAELSWACLLGGFGVRVERLQARVQPAKEIVSACLPGWDGAPPRMAAGTEDNSEIFETRTEWSEPHLAKTG
jgi:recA bacterial DNA recombination protein